MQSHAYHDVADEHSASEASQVSAWASDGEASEASQMSVWASDGDGLVKELQALGGWGWGAGGSK